MIDSLVVGSAFILFLLLALSLQVQVVFFGSVLALSTFYCGAIAEVQRKVNVCIQSRWNGSVFRMLEVSWIQFSCAFQMILMQQIWKKCSFIFDITVLPNADSYTYKDTILLGIRSWTRVFKNIFQFGLIFFLYQQKHTSGGMDFLRVHWDPFLFPIVHLAFFIHRAE